MLIKEVIPAQFMQNLDPEKLLPHNEKYYRQCLAYISETAYTTDAVLADEINKLVLLHIREAQLDGKRAEERFGTDISLFVEQVVTKRANLSPVEIFKKNFQFPLYAFSMYLIGYAFFAFLLAAWHGYSLTMAWLFPLPFSAIGLLLGGIILCIMYTLLFYRRQLSDLIFAPRNQKFKNMEYLNYVGIGFSFLVPYLALRLQLTNFSVQLWVVLAIGIGGVLLARRQFIATDTLPV